MATLYWEYGQDPPLNANGGFNKAQGWDEARQNITRNVMTVPLLKNLDGSYTPPEYIFIPTFGQGVRAMIGNLNTPDFQNQLQQRFAAAAAQSIFVDHSQPVSVAIQQPSPQLVYVYCTVVLVSGAKYTFGLQLGS